MILWQGEREVQNGKNYMTYLMDDPKEYYKSSYNIIFLV